MVTLHTPQSRSMLFSIQLRRACPVDIPLNANCRSQTAGRRKVFAGFDKMVGAERLALPRLPDSESGGSSVPRKPHAVKIGASGRTLTRKLSVRSGA